MRRGSRKIIISLAVILAWLGFVVEGTKALLTDTATVLENNITSGSVDLKISSSDSLADAQFTQDVVGLAHGLLPGQTDTQTVYIKNDSDSNVPLEISAACLGAPDNPVSNYEDYQIVVTKVDEAGVAISDPTVLTIENITSGGSAVGPNLAQGESGRYRIDTRLLESSTVHNIAVRYNVVFTGTQAI